MIALIGMLSVGAATANFEGATTKENAIVHTEKHVAKNPKGGFVGGEEVVVTVRQVNEMRDDVPVVVKGKIVKRVGDEKYLFEDETDSITVEIDDEDWRGQTISPSDTVKLYGDVDRGIFSTEIDVDYVQKM